MKLLVFVSLIFPALVAAQEWGPVAPAQQQPPSNNDVAAAAAASNGTSNAFLVTLGENDAVAFTPTTLTGVQVNDTVTFVVSGQSEVAHGVVESTADAPCTQRQGGFDSGLINPNDNFTVLVNSTNPIFIFCPQFSPFDHCTDGMVMIINPATPSDINSFEAAATTVQNEATATAPAPVGVDLVSTSISVIPTAASSGSSSSSSPSSGTTAPATTNTSGALSNLASISTAVLSAAFALTQVILA